MNYTVFSDQELINSFIAGNNEALEVLFLRHKDKVYSYIYITVRNKALAEDIFQDTFIKVLNSLREGRYNEHGKFLGWVLRIAHNLIIDHFRREKQMSFVSDDILLGGSSHNKNHFDKNIEDAMVKEQIYSDAKRMIEFLPAEQREVVLLRIFGDLSFKEIADMTEVSLNTALGRMRYALINLRKLAEEHKIILEE